MAQNMYRVGDYVYFETQAAAPYQIRRIEELVKTSTGAVEVKVTCFFRRRDLPNSLLKIADQAERQSQILSKPRKTLLGKSSEPTTSSAATSTAAAARAAATENGEEPSENGMEEEEGGREGREDKKSGEAEEEGKKDKEGTEDGKKEDEEGEPDDDEHGREKKKDGNSFGFAGLPSGADKLNPTELFELRQHELFLSRIIETMPATQIRGKCAVVILNEVETCEQYLGQEDSFFYSLVYDPANQTLLADKGRIEIGERHQAAIPELIQQKEEEKEKEKEEGEEEMETDEKEEAEGKEEKKEGIQITDRESVVYHLHHNLTDRDIDQFLIIARAVGTFSRALDSSSSTKLTTLHQTASVASRDITLLHAMALLHQANYDLGQATKFLVPPPDKLHYPLEADKVTSHNTVSLGGPILCRDQLEEWSASESTLFEDAIEKYGKDFHDIRLDCLPWKSMRDIVEYYYMWKTTSRYAELQKAKHAEQENKLKQLYVPNYNKPSPNLITGVHALSIKIPCESCKASESKLWYAWGPHAQFRVCGDCWMVWKKRGGLKQSHEFDTYDLEGSAVDGRSTNRPGGMGRNGLPQSALKGVGGHNTEVGQKGRVAFYLNSALEARVARRLAPKHIFNVRKAARCPSKDFNIKALQEYYFTRPLADVLHTAHQVKRGVISKWAEIHLTKLHEKRGMIAAATAVAGMAQNGGTRRS